MPNIAESRRIYSETRKKRLQLDDAYERGRQVAPQPDPVNISSLRCISRLVLEATKETKQVKQFLQVMGVDLESAAAEDDFLEMCSPRHAMHAIRVREALLQLAELRRVLQERIRQRGVDPSEDKMRKVLLQELQHLRKALSTSHISKQIGEVEECLGNLRSILETYHFSDEVQQYTAKAATAVAAIQGIDISHPVIKALAKKYSRNETAGSEADPRAARASHARPRKNEVRMSSAERIGHGKQELDTSPRLRSNNRMPVPMPEVVDQECFDSKEIIFEDDLLPSFAGEEDGDQPVREASKRRRRSSSKKRPQAKTDKEKPLADKGRASSKGRISSTPVKASSPKDAEGSLTERRGSSKPRPKDPGVRRTTDPGVRRTSDPERDLRREVKEEPGAAGRESVKGPGAQTRTARPATSPQLPTVPGPKATSRTSVPFDSPAGPSGGDVRDTKALRATGAPGTVGHGVSSPASTAALPVSAVDAHENRGEPEHQDRPLGESESPPKAGGPIEVEAALLEQVFSGQRVVTKASSAAFSDVGDSGDFEVARPATADAAPLWAPGETKELEAMPTADHGRRKLQKRLSQVAIELDEVKNKQPVSSRSARSPETNMERRASGSATQTRQPVQVSPPAWRPRWAPLTRSSTSVTPEEATHSLVVNAGGSGSRWPALRAKIMSGRAAAAEKLTPPVPAESELEGRSARTEGELGEKVRLPLPPGWAPRQARSPARFQWRFDQSTLEGNPFAGDLITPLPRQRETTFREEAESIDIYAEIEEDSGGSDSGDDALTVVEVVRSLCTQDDAEWCDEEVTLRALFTLTPDLEGREGDETDSLLAWDALAQEQSGSCFASTAASESESEEDEAEFLHDLLQDSRSCWLHSWCRGCREVPRASTAGSQGLPYLSGSTLSPSPRDPRGRRGSVSIEAVLTYRFRRGFRDQVVSEGLEEQYMCQMSKESQLPCFCRRCVWESHPILRMW